MNTPNEDVIDFRDVLGIIRRQSRLILLTFVVVLAIAFVYVVQATPMYRATALIKLNPQETNLLDPNSVGSINGSVETTLIETEVEILKSSNLAIKTIEATGLSQTDEFGPKVGTIDKFRAALGFELPPLPAGDELTSATLSRFGEALTVRRRGLTYLVQVTFVSSNPKLSALLANTHAQTYQLDQVSGKVETFLQSRDILSKQLETARMRLSQTNDALQNYIGVNVEDLARETGSARLAELASELRALASSAPDIDAARLAFEAEDWNGLTQQVGDQALASLQEQRSELLNRMQGLQQDSREALDLEVGLQKIDTYIKSRGETILSGLANGVDANQTRQSRLLGDIQSEVLRSELSASTLTDIYGLQQEAQVAQTQYDQLIRRMRELEDQSVVQVANSRIVSEALEPRLASFPNKKLTLALAFVVALIIGFGLAMLKEFFLGGVTSAHQLSNVVPAKVGAVVPKLSFQSSKDVPADKIVTEQLSQFSEAYRKLRASIDHQVKVEDGKGMVMLVTSAIPAEGKSTTALSLARTYAVAGKRTLLIDADLRNPAIHKFIKEEPGAGLMEYLMSQQSEQNVDVLNPVDGPAAPVSGEAVEEFYVVDPQSRLGIILGSHRANVPTDAPLQSQVFQDLLQNARSAFDVIVVDTAPLLPVVDTRYIAPLVDAAVMCVRFGEASQSELRTSYMQLADSLGEDTPIVTTLNCFEGIRQTHYYGSYYGQAKS